MSIFSQWIKQTGVRGDYSFILRFFRFLSLMRYTYVLCFRAIPKVKSVATLCEHKFTISLRIISKDFKSLYDNGALFHKRRLEIHKN